MKKNTKVPKIPIIIVSAILLFYIIFGALLYIELKSIGKQYITTDIANYGIYKGNYDNETVESFITGFFPEKIDENFSDVKYSYRAQKGDSYAYEAYLEFVVTDKERYKAICEKYTSELEGKEFPYANIFTEYIIEDDLDPWKDDDGEIQIEYAEIGKILCSEKEQRIIFVALGVYDGGMVNTDFLNVYFNRFNIDPLKYGETGSSFI